MPASYDDQRHMPDPKSGRPRPEDYPSRAECRWARKLWLRKHGGSFIGTLAIAVFFTSR
jgi:hypothetical protein